MALDAEDIASRRFSRSLRGYAPREVEAFLRDVAREYSTLEAELASAREAARGAAESERLLQRTLVAAQRTADETVATAREEAAQVLSQTAAEAEEMLEAARRDASEQREAARRLVAAARDAIEQLRRFRDDYRDQVRVVVAEQLAAVDRAGQLPDLPEDLDQLVDAADSPRELRLDDAENTGDAMVDEYAEQALRARPHP